MYFYFQFLTIDQDAPGDADGLGRKPSIKKTHREAVPEQPPLEPLITEVSTTGSVFIFCRKGLSLKLLLKGIVTILW